MIDRFFIGARSGSYDFYAETSHPPIIVKEPQLPVIEEPPVVVKPKKVKPPKPKKEKKPLTKAQKKKRAMISLAAVLAIVFL